MYGVVYLIENICNAKVYVGITTRGVSKRFEEHCVAETYIGRAIRKYGRDNFRISIIDQADDHFELCEKEKAWIKTYKAFGDGYNLTHGGDGVDQVVYIENNYTDLQIRFLEQCEKERHDPVDVHDSYKMVRLCLMYTMEAFLVSNTKKDKKLVTDTILKLKPELIKIILQSKIITKNDLKQWV